MSYTPPIGAATGTVRGVLKLAGDLSGTADAPTVGSAAPGASRYFGTDATGVKGYYALPGGSDPAMGGDLSGTASNAQIKTGVVTTAELSASAVTQPKIAATNSPISGQYLSYDGTNMTWATPAASGLTDGTRFLDSFAGATDDLKLTAAIAWQKATDGMPAIRLGARAHTFNQTRNLYSGLKIIGSPSSQKNPEQSTTYVPTKITLGSAITTAASAWWVPPAAGGDIFDVYMSSFCVTGSSVQQFIEYPPATGTIYASEFNSLSFVQMMHVFGRPAQQAALTQVVFSGMWSALNFAGTQFTLGGSDNSLWMNGYINIGPGSTPGVWGSEPYQVYFAWLENTNVGYMYVTAENGWRGIKIEGNSGNGLFIYGGVFEGVNSSTPAPGTVIYIKGGSGAFFGPGIGQAMGSPVSASEKGYVHIEAGEWAFHSPSFYHGATAETVPMIYHSGGRVSVYGAIRDMSETWAGRPRYLTTAASAPLANATGYSFYCNDMSMTA